MKITLNKVLFISAALALAFRAYPSGEAKAAQPLRLNPPVESPDGVAFTWTNGSADTPHSIWRRVKGEAEWTRIAMGLGPSGMTVIPGFTLDKTYEYKIQADPE